MFWNSADGGSPEEASSPSFWGAMATKQAESLNRELANDSKRALELLGSIFYCGKFVAETRNEQELELLMRKHGYFIETEAQFDAYCARLEGSITGAAK